MSLEVKGGITSLSELIIDADKDWQGYGISNLESVVAAMVKGDLTYRNAAVLDRLPLSYGIGYNFLHALDAGVGLPEWLDIEDIIIFLTGAVNRLIAPPVLIATAPTLNLATAESHAGGLVTDSHALTVPTPVISVAATTLAPALAVDGGVAHDDDVGDTDETAETNSAIANDMHLLPNPGALGDGFYFGLATQWDWVCLNIGTPGAGVWTITWKYWTTIATWAALTLKYDQTDHFRAAAGKHWVHFERPADWALNTIAGIADLYWIKGEVTNYTNMVTQPLGTQAWIGQY